MENELRIIAETPNKLGETQLWFEYGNQQVSELTEDTLAEIVGIPINSKLRKKIREIIIENTSLRPHGESREDDGKYFPISLVRYGSSYSWTISKFQTDSFEELKAHRAKLINTLGTIFNEIAEEYQKDEDRITEKKINQYFPLNISVVMNRRR